MVCITVKDGPLKGKVCPVSDSGVRIGRDNDVHIHVMDQGVSRQHAEIYRIGEMYFIRDLGSRNGTYVNEERIKEELLREGDRIRIGQTTLVFEDSAQTDREMAEQVHFSHVEADPAATMEFRFGVGGFADIEDPVEAKVQQVSRTKKPKYLSILYQVARAISSESDVGELLAKIVSMSANAVNADHGYIFTKDPGKEKPELKLIASFEKEGSPAPEVSTTIIKRVAKYGRAVLTADASIDKRFSDKSSVIMKGVKAVICAPLVAREVVNGVVYLSTTSLEHAFTPEDLELVTAIGIQVGIALNDIRIVNEQRKMFTSIISTLVNAVEMRDPALRGHSGRVAHFAVAIAKVLKLPSKERNSLHVAAILHDTGMLLISEADIAASRSEPGAENSLEYKRAMASEKLLQNIEGFRGILPAVKHSFEKHDGSGVPDGLAGKDIPLHARIIATARTFDEILSEGAKEELSLKDALFKLNARAQEGEIDPELVKALAIAYRMGIIEGSRR